MAVGTQDSYHKRHAENKRTNQDSSGSECQQMNLLAGGKKSIVYMQKLVGGMLPVCNRSDNKLQMFVALCNRTIPLLSTSIDLSSTQTITMAKELSQKAITVRICRRQYLVVSSDTSKFLQL